MTTRKNDFEQVRITMMNELTGEIRIMQEAFLTWKAVTELCKKTETNKNPYYKWIIVKIEKLMGNGTPYL